MDQPSPLQGSTYTEKFLQRTRGVRVGGEFWTLILSAFHSHIPESSGLTDDSTMAEYAQCPRFQGGSVLGGVLGTSSGFSMDQKRGQAALAVRNGPGLTSLGIPVTFNKLPPQSVPASAPTSPTGITVAEFLSENCHENECVSLSKQDSG